MFPSPNTSSQKKPCQKVTYRKSWNVESSKVTSGFEFGRRCTCGMTHWPELKAWERVADFISFEFQVLVYEVVFHFHHPSEWRFWAVRIYS